METKQKILKLFPERLHPLMRGTYYTVFFDSYKEPKGNEDTKFPHNINTVPDKLPSERYSDITLLPNRQELLRYAPSDGNTAEIGVATGDFAENILEITQPDELYLIDIWEDQSTMRTVEEKFADDIDKNKVQLVRKDSIKALQRFEDNYFDFVYLDTTHLYKRTVKELNLLKKKTKQDGMIAGHDFSVGNLPSRQMYGVIPAVFQFCVESDWKIEYLTLQPDGHDSFGLTKVDTK